MNNYGSMDRPAFLFASTSPGRRQLLAAAVYDFTLLPPREVCEDALPNEPPEALVRRLAVAKAEAAAREVSSAAGHPNTGLLIGCDTVAECSGEILGKPADRDDARRMLRLL